MKIWRIIRFKKNLGARNYDLDLYIEFRLIKCGSVKSAIQSKNTSVISSDVLVRYLINCKNNIKYYNCYYNNICLVHCFIY